MGLHWVFLRLIVAEGLWVCTLGIVPLGLQVLSKRLIYVFCSHVEIYPSQGYGIRSKHALRFSAQRLSWKWFGFGFKSVGGLPAFLAIVDSTITRPT